MRNAFLKASLAAISLCAGTASAATIGTFTGGDPGEGLDLQGTFLYATYVGGPAGPLQIGDAVFTDADSNLGIDVIGPANTTFGTPDYGNSLNDNNLEQVLDFVRFGATTNVVAAVSQGTSYKLQMMFNEACCDRGFDIRVNGTLVVDSFNPGRTQGGTGGAAPQNVGAVVTYEFTATDPLLNIELRAHGFPDPNAIFDAMTLENTTLAPEPGGVAAVMTLLGMPLLRRRRCR